MFLLRLSVVFLKHHKPTACWPAWALILEAGRRLLFLTLILGLFLRVWIFCKASEADRTPGWNEGSWPVLLQVPKYFVLSQIFWSLPKFKLHLVPLQKILYQQKNWIYEMEIIIWSGIKKMGLAQFVNQFLVWHKKFGPAQNILGPVEGQGRSVVSGKVLHNSLHW